MELAYMKKKCEEHYFIFSLGVPAAHYDISDQF